MFPRFQPLIVAVAALCLAISPRLHGEETAPYLDPAGLKGPLVIAGGGELPPAILERFVKLAGDEKALLVIIPTASEQADKQLSSNVEKAKLLEPWVKLGAEQIHVLHTRS